MDSGEPNDRQDELTDPARRPALGDAEDATKLASGQPPETQIAGRPPSPPPNSFAGYKIVREIHRGGQGVVYQAFQASTRRKVAIKVMKEGPFAGSADKARFEREVQVLGQLKHPNIVTVHDSGTATLREELAELPE